MFLKKFKVFRTTKGNFRISIEFSKKPKAFRMPKSISRVFSMFKRSSKVFKMLRDKFKMFIMFSKNSKDYKAHNQISRISNRQKLSRGNRFQHFSMNIDDSLP